MISAYKKLFTLVRSFLLWHYQQQISCLRLVQQTYQPWNLLRAEVEVYEMKKGTGSRAFIFSYQ